MSNQMLQAEVIDKSSALDLIFGFLHMAQRRGAFSFPESAKIYECMNQFADFFQHDETQEEYQEENEVPVKEEVVDDDVNEKFDSDEDTIDEKPPL